MRATMMAQIRREMSIGEGKMVGRAMVALADRAQAGAMALPLTRSAIRSTPSTNAEEGARLLEQGVYDLVVARRAGRRGGTREPLPAPQPPEPGAPPPHLPRARGRRVQDRRRHAGLGGDGRPRHRGARHPRRGRVLLPALAERTRLYQVFLDARKRYEASAV
jgi:hypothetical protein